MIPPGMGGRHGKLARDPNGQSKLEYMVFPWLGERCVACLSDGHRPIGWNPLGMEGDRFCSPGRVEGSPLSVGMSQESG